MDWIKSLLLKSIKQKAIDEAKKFQWSERERQILLADGYTDAQIALSEKMFRAGGASWVDRQVKV